MGVDQLSLAKDEPKAFIQEIKFFDNSPKWFRNKVKNIKFDSGLLNLKSVNYRDYYKALKAKIKDDESFILKRYIELGLYPKCMLSLI